MDDRRDERTLGQLFGDLTRQMSTLVRQEIDLARAEMTSKASELSRDTAMVGIGAVLVYAGFLGLMAAVALVLIQAGLDPWLSALVVAVVVAAAGGALIQRGRAGLAKADLAPRRTVETIRDDAELVKERMR